MQSSYRKRREFGAGKEKSIGWLMAGGLTLTVISVVLIGLGVVLGIFKGSTQEHAPGLAGLLRFFPLTVMGAGIGILMMVGGLAYGIYAERTLNRGPRQIETNFRVLSRLCLDKNFQLLISDTDIEFAKKPRFYIRGLLSNGLVGEFETTIEVFYNAGEGMFGEADIQGNWLGSFIPYIGEAEVRSGDFIQR